MRNGGDYSFSPNDFLSHGVGRGGGVGTGPAQFLGTNQNLSWRGGGGWRRNEIFQNKNSGPPLRVKKN